VETLSYGRVADIVEEVRREVWTVERLEKELGEER
jgi:hypothetical protein